MIDPSRNYLLMILLLLALSSLMMACGPAAEPFGYEIQVRDVTTGGSIANAVVRVETGVRNVYQATANTGGVARLTIDPEYLGRWAKIIVEADEYKKHSVLVHLLQESPSATVGLEPLSAEAPAEQPAGAITPPSQPITGSETITPAGQ